MIVLLIDYIINKYRMMTLLTENRNRGQDNRGKVSVLIMQNKYIIYLYDKKYNTIKIYIQ